MNNLTCFKANDIRGQIGSQLNEELVYKISRAFGVYLSIEQKGNTSISVVVGRDNRLTSQALKNTVVKGLIDSGIDVIDIGMTGTEEVYFATQHLQADGGIEITASHNPIDYNGMKLVREQAIPLSRETGLDYIKSLVEKNDFPEVDCLGAYVCQSNLKNYADHLMSYINPENIKPLKIVVNAGNGAAGHVIDEIEQRFSVLNVPTKFIKINHQPDGNFPNGIPNPLLPECRADTQEAVIQHQADMGIAWDGDFDRCFFFDEKGQFIEGYYVVGLLAKAFLQKHKGAKIVHDPRLIWNTKEIAGSEGGIAIESKSGHAYIKDTMRSEDAVYGGEMSAHHYFREFGYCDSGMIPWLLVSELLSNTQLKLSELVSEGIDKYPSSGEINFKLDVPEIAIKDVLSKYKDTAKKIDNIDGITIEHDQWRFNLRCSNTEPLVRLNVESKGNKSLMEEKTEEILSILTN